MKTASKFGFELLVRSADESLLAVLAREDEVVGLWRPAHELLPAVGLRFSRIAWSTGWTGMWRVAPVFVPFSTRIGLLNDDSKVNRHSGRLERSRSRRAICRLARTNAAQEPECVEGAPVPWDPTIRRQHHDLCQGEPRRRAPAALLVLHRGKVPVGIPACRGNPPGLFLDADAAVVGRVPARRDGCDLVHVDRTRARGGGLNGGPGWLTYPSGPARISRNGCGQDFRNRQNPTQPKYLRAAGEGMFGAMKRHEIQVLRRAGHTQADVARLAGTSERTVRRVEEEPAVTSFDPGETNVSSAPWARQA